MDWLSGRGREPAGETTPASAERRRLADEVVPLVNDASGAGWYKEYANPVDVALVRLCRLRRAAAGQAGEVEGGDEAVRRALGEADPAAVVWLASRVVSYLDEQDYPETMRPWIPA